MRKFLYLNWLNRLNYYLPYRTTHYLFLNDKYVFNKFKTKIIGLDENIFIPEFSLNV